MNLYLRSLSYCYGAWRIRLPLEGISRIWHVLSRPSQQGSAEQRPLSEIVQKQIGVNDRFPVTEGVDDDAVPRHTGV